MNTQIDFCKSHYQQILDILILLVSLAGFVGAYWNKQGLLAFHLFCMAILIVLLLILLVCAFIVTRPNGAYDVPGRNYKEYRLDVFSNWLRDHVINNGNWGKIRTCLSESDVCISANQFFATHLSPLQWLDLLNTMLREALWTRNKLVPTIDEYLANGYVSSALGPIVLPALYFVGPKLSEEIIITTEFHNLFKLMGTCGRLLNDIQTFERGETKEGKLNTVNLRMIHGNGVITEEHSVQEMRSIIESSRKELLRLVLQEKKSVVPRACKNLFWEMSKVVHLFYMKNDGFTSHDMINAVNEILHKPIVLKKC